MWGGRKHCHHSLQEVGKGFWVCIWGKWEGAWREGIHKGVIVIIVIHRSFDLWRPCHHHLVGALSVVGHQSSPVASVIIVCHRHCHMWRKGKGGGQHCPSPMSRCHCHHCHRLVGASSSTTIVIGTWRKFASPRSCDFHVEPHHMPHHTLHPSSACETRRRKKVSHASAATPAHHITQPLSAAQGPMTTTQWWQWHPHQMTTMLTMRGCGGRTTMTPSPMPSLHTPSQSPQMRTWKPLSTLCDDCWWCEDVGDGRWQLPRRHLPSTPLPICPKHRYGSPYLPCVTTTTTPSLTLHNNQWWHKDVRNGWWWQCLADAHLALLSCTTTDDNGGCGR